MELRKLSSLTVTRKDFPEDFLWGASVAAHQVEGKTKNQWSRWEHMNAVRLANRAERDTQWVPVWNSIREEATDPRNYLSGDAVNHYDEYKKDFILAKKLGLNAFRSGFEWSRICHKEGHVNHAALTHYQDYIDTLHAQKLEPVLSLFHWTEPVWFSDMGGFTNKKNLKHWRHYVRTLVSELDLKNVKYILTINEANTYMTMGYMVGLHAPGEKNPLRAWKLYRNLALAHRIAYKEIKQRYPHIQIGFAHQYNKIIAKNFTGSVYAALQKYWWNYAWIRWCRQFDFVGFNYYFSDYWTGRIKRFDINREPPINDLGWHMEPSGIEWVLNDIRKRWPKKPILITENGVADMHDQFREWWIVETIEAIKRAMDDGARVIGYLHWSLLDNFEWQFGWWPKFGLISVDRTTMKRTIKPSAKAWARWLS